MTNVRTLVASISLFLMPKMALAQSTPVAVDDPASGSQNATEHREAPHETPIFAYTYSAQQVAAKSIGVQAYGLGLVAPGQDRVLGGGGAVWGSPFDRLTVIADGQRSLSREFSPSVAAIVRIYGEGREGFSLGALGKFKVEGFAGGPSHDEIESEMEVGALASYRGFGWYLDANLIAGRGLGDDGETDAEGRLRVGRELGSAFRVGFDGQIRSRVAGPRYLPNGRTWDFAAGPQLVAFVDRFYGSLTAGPTTMGLLSTDIGWSAMFSVGGAAF
jgi:hypothetical protein